jgi:hypothetical protein
MFSCNATIQCPRSAEIPGVEYRDTMSVVITYYNVYQETFLENAMILCIGSLLITEEDSVGLILAVRAHCLIRFELSYRTPSLSVLC